VVWLTGLHVNYHRASPDGFFHHHCVPVYASGSSPASGWFTGFPCVWDAAQPVAHRYTVDHDCASSNLGFRAAIVNSYIRVLSPLHSALVPVQCQRAAQPSHHSGHGWLEVVKKPSAIHPLVKTGGLLAHFL
jgi:hypothetical protein